jgi:hypothetical protein
MMAGINKLDNNKNEGNISFFVSQLLSFYCINAVSSLMAERSIHIKDVGLLDYRLHS